MTSEPPSSPSPCAIDRSVRAGRLRQSLERLGFADEANDPGMVAGLLQMKIALMGNMNNAFFAFARYLADLGLDTTLLTFPFEISHFLPECDTYQTGHGVTIRQLPWTHVMAAESDWLYSHVSEFDYIFGCGLSVAFMARIGLDLDVFFPYGSDLYEYPFLWSDDGDYDKHRDPSRYFFGKWQAAGLAHCRAIWSYDSFVDAEVAKIVNDANIVEMHAPFVHAPSYQGQNLAATIAQSPFSPRFQDIRRDHDVVVFHHARHIWKTHVDHISGKGNDILIRGFAAFVRDHPQVRACLICLEYGPDVEASKDLVRQLGIAERVAWLPLMHRRDLMVGLSYSDIGTGDFVFGCHYGGTVIEVLMMGKPLFHYVGEHGEGTSPPDIFDCVQVGTPGQIADALADYVRRPAHYAEIGRRGQQWFQEQSVDKTLRWCLASFRDRIHERTAAPRRHEREVNRLRRTIADLRTDLEAVQAENQRLNRIGRTLFGDPVLKDCPADLAWYIRSGLMARQMLGDHPLGDIAPELQPVVRALVTGYAGGGWWARLLLRLVGLLSRRMAP